MANIPRGHRMSPLNHDPEGLAYAIRKSGLTQRQVAEQLHMSAGHLSEIVNGTRNARQPLLEAMAKVLNCPVVVLEAKRVAS